MAYIVPGAGLGGERKSRWQRIKERLKGAPGRWGKRKAILKQKVRRKEKQTRTETRWRWGKQKRWG